MCEYDSKELSFAIDVFNAFLGVMITFGHTFDWGILYGLPEMFFDVALLWQRFGKLKRRQEETRREDHRREEHKREYNNREERRHHYREDTRKEYVMPSWSWMGWQGQLDPRSWACGYDYICAVDPGFRRSVVWKKTSLRVLSSIDWYCCAGGQGQRRRIECTSQSYNTKGLCEDLPTRWKKVQEDSTAAPYYVHNSDSDTKLEYPIPIRDASLSPEAKFPTPLLYCQTRRPFFNISQSFTPASTNGEAPECETVLLSRLGHKLVKVGEQPEFIGILRLKTKPFVHGLNNRRPHELVDISSGFAENN